MNLTKPLSWKKLVFFFFYIVDEERNQLHERKSYQGFIFNTINKVLQFQRLQYQQSFIYDAQKSVSACVQIHTYLHTCIQMHLQNNTYSCLLLINRYSTKVKSCVTLIEVCFSCIKIQEACDATYYSLCATSDQLILNTSSVKLKGFLVCFNLKVI